MQMIQRQKELQMLTLVESPEYYPPEKQELVIQKFYRYSNINNATLSFIKQQTKRTKAFYHISQGEAVYASFANHRSKRLQHEVRVKKIPASTPS